MNDKLKCYCCKVNYATQVDYRERDTILSKYFVCDDCLHLTDSDFFNKRDKCLEVINSRNWYCTNCLSTSVKIKTYCSLNDFHCDERISDSVLEITHEQCELLCFNCGDKIIVKRKS